MGVVVAEDESAYKDVIDEDTVARFCVRCSCIARGTASLLRLRLWSPWRAGQSFGYRWPVLGADALNKAAKHLGPKFNVLSVQGKQVDVAPAYFKFHPAVFLRMFDAGLSYALSLN
jgi:hypothetical protein